LLCQLSEDDVELLLHIAEVFAKRPGIRSVTEAPTQQVSAAASAAATTEEGAASPGAATVPPASGRPTYTVAEAAQLLGMKETTLRERIRMGRVPVLRLGHRVLVRSEELERQLTERSAAKERGNGERQRR
jgi:excisionase family DNA binding protein